MVDHVGVAPSTRSEERQPCVHRAPAPAPAAAPRDRPAAPLAWRLALALSLPVALTLSGASAVAAPAPVTTEAPAPTPTPPPAATTPESAPPAGAATPTEGAPDDEGDAAVVPEAPTRQASYAARLVVPVVIRKAPSPKAGTVTRLQPFGTWNGGPVVLSIAEVRTVDGVRWLRVRLPIRPNGASGWLPEDNVEVRRLRYRIEISRKLHKLNLLRDGQRIGSTRVVIGAASTPTPAGQFAVLEVVRQPKGSVLGPWALHLTAHSNVLDNYGGGPGRVALHGRSGALLNDPLGTSRSHGCIRMPNAFVARLQRVAVEGTPVVIR